MIDDVRERLVGTVERLLRSGRKAETLTSREIAAAAGVSLGLVNYHFGSKDALVAKAAERIFADLAPRWASVAEAAKAARGLPARGKGGDAERAAVLAAFRAGKEELKSILHDFAEATELASGGSDFILRHELLEGDLDTTKFLAPILRSFLPPGTDERELRRACFFIVAPLQLLYLRRAWFSDWAGADLSIKIERDRAIDSLVDGILEPFAGTPGRES